MKLIILIIFNYFSCLISITSTIFINNFQDNFQISSNCNTTSTLFISSSSSSSLSSSYSLELKTTNTSTPSDTSITSTTNSNNSCNLRSAILLCSYYLIHSNDICSIIIPKQHIIYLNSTLNEIKLNTLIGQLNIIGNNSTLTPYDYIKPMKFLTLTQTNTNYLSLKIDNLHFHNFSSLSTGGVFNLQYLNQINMNNLHFYNNSAISGGTIYIDYSTFINITSCTFISNNAQDGGAIQFNSNNNKIFIINSLFYNNIATGNSINSRNQGGGIYFNLLNTNIQILNCKFFYNQGLNGGAIYFHSDNKYILLSFNQFYYNSADSGGAFMIYNRNLYVTVQHTLFNNNYALKYFGGGMYTYSSNFDTLLYNVTFNQNTAFYGGALNADSDNTNLRLFECIFLNNTASYGAAFTLYSSHEITLIHNCLFRNNQALYEAGAIYVVSINEDIEIYNCKFISNEAGTNGGSIAFVNGNTNITFLNTLFTLNKAGKSGGSIYSALTTTNWKIENCNFYFNRARTYGGAISIANDNENMQLISSQLIKNIANIGGSIYVGNTNNRITIISCEILNNIATTTGGGIVLLSSVSAIYSSNIINNTAYESGGIHIDESTNVILSNIQFIENIAYFGNGGGLSILGKGTIYLINLKYKKNKAINGGGVYLSSIKTILLQNNKFEYNNASENGGAIYSIDIQSFQIISSNFLYNSALSTGGGIIINSIEYFSLNYSNFIGNTCYQNNARGSALWISNSPSIIENNYFESNFVTLGSGTVFWLDSTMSEPIYLTTKNIYQNNNAIYGNSIATEATSILVSNSIINVTTFNQPILSFEVYLVDYYKQIVRTDYISVVEFNLLNSNNLFCYNGGGYLTGGIIEDFYGGIATVNQLEAHCAPGEKYTVVASTFINEIDLTLKTQFEISFRECYSGEINVQGECIICSNLLYSFNPTDTECIICPENAQCPGGNRMDLKPGYWRQCQYCNIIEPCRLPDACLGGENVTIQCKEGHTGPLCNLCKDGYALGADLKCAKCSSSSGIISIILLPTIIFLLIIILIITYIYRDIVIIYLHNILESIQNIIEKYKLESFRTKIKILIAFGQILTSLPIMFDVTYPRSFSRLLDAISFTNLNFLNIFSIECIWRFTFYDVLLVYTIGPMILMIILCFILHCRMIVAKRINERMPSYTLENRNNQMKLVCIFIAFVVFSPTSIKIFQTFVCEKFEDGTETLIADSSISCKTEKWKYYVIYSSFMSIIYPLGIPVFYLYSLYSDIKYINPSDELVVRIEERELISSEIIQNEKIKLRETYHQIRGLTFLFDSYLPINWYFEIIECFRRLLLTSIPILFLRSTILQIVLVELISLGFCALYMEFRPYSNKSDNLVAIYSQWAVTLTVLGSLCLRVDMTDEVSFGPDAVGILLAIINIFVAILTCIATVRSNPDSVKKELRNSLVDEKIAEENKKNSQKYDRDRINSLTQSKKFSEINWGEKTTSIEEKKSSLKEGKDSDDDDDDNDNNNNKNSNNGIDYPQVRNRNKSTISTISTLSTISNNKDKDKKNDSDDSDDDDHHNNNQYQYKFQDQDWNQSNTHNTSNKNKDNKKNKLSEQKEVIKVKKGVGTQYSKNPMITSQNLPQRQVTEVQESFEL